MLAEWKGIARQFPLLNMPFWLSFAALTLINTLLTPLYKINPNSASALIII